MATEFCPPKPKLTSRWTIALPVQQELIRATDSTCCRDLARVHGECATSCQPGYDDWFRSESTLKAYQGHWTLGLYVLAFGPIVWGELLGYLLTADFVGYTCCMPLGSVPITGETPLKHWKNKHVFAHATRYRDTTCNSATRPHVDAGHMPWRAAACDRVRLALSGAQGYYGARRAATRAGAASVAGAAVV